MLQNPLKHFIFALGKKLHCTNQALFKAFYKHECSQHPHNVDQRNYHSCNQTLEPVSCPTQQISASLLSPERFLEQLLLQMSQIFLCSASILSCLCLPHWKLKCYNFFQHQLCFFRRKTRRQLVHYLQGHFQFYCKSDIPGIPTPSVVPILSSIRFKAKNKLYNQYLLNCKIQGTSISSTIPGSSPSGMS